MSPLLLGLEDWLETPPLDGKEKRNTVTEGR